MVRNLLLQQQLCTSFCNTINHGIIPLVFLDPLNWFSRTSNFLIYLFMPCSRWWLHLVVVKASAMYSTNTLKKKCSELSLFQSRCELSQQYHQSLLTQLSSNETTIICHECTVSKHAMRIWDRLRNDRQMACNFPRYKVLHSFISTPKSCFF